MGENSRSRRRPTDGVGMALETPIGDLVRLEDDERFDIPDARRLQLFVYEALADALGGLCGARSGVLSAPTFEGPVGALRIGECMLAGFKRRPGSSVRYRGGVFHYDPERPYQAGSTTVNLSAYQATEALPYLWFCRRETDADIENRRIHVGGVEATYSPHTTRRQYLGFGVSASSSVPPNTSEDWFVFARVTGWSGVAPERAPLIQPIHVLDLGLLEGGSYETLRNQLGLFMMASDFDASPMRALSLLTQMVLRVTSRTHAFDVHSLKTLAPSDATLNPDPAMRGVLELHEDLAAVEQSLSDLPTMLAWGSVQANGAVSGGVFQGLTKRHATPQADEKGTATYTFHVRALAEPTVQVTPRDYSASVLFQGPVTVEVYPAPPHHYRVVVQTYAASGAFADKPFFVTVWGKPG